MVFLYHDKEKTTNSITVKDAGGQLCFRTLVVLVSRLMLATNNKQEQLSSVKRDRTLVEHPWVYFLACAQGCPFVQKNGPENAPGGL